MNIDLVSILAFVISVLLIPALIYIWNESRKEVSDMKKQLNDHIKNAKEEHDALYDKATKNELDLKETKINYIERFSNLNNNINHKFEVMTEVVNDKFNTINSTISNLASDVKLLVQSHK